MQNGIGKDFTFARASRLGVLAVVLLGLFTVGSTPAEPQGMAWWEAVVLGVVEGLTEYLPVSSTGHLLITQQLLGIGTESAQATEAANAYAICIQAGAIVAVLGLYWRRVKQVVKAWVGVAGVGTKDPVGFSMGVNIVVAFLPAAVVGLLFNDAIEAYLFGAWPVVAAWFVGGGAILAVGFWKKRKSGDEHVGVDLEQLTWKMALVIGLIQCIAMWPGTSRSLVTIVGGMLVGLSLAAAVEFSFLLGVVTLLAATVYKAADAGPVMLDAYGWGPMIVGSIAAYISAVLAVRWMVEYLKKHGIELFGYYRIAIACIVAGLLLAGVLSAA